MVNNSFNDHKNDVFGKVGKLLLRLGFLRIKKKHKVIKLCKVGYEVLILQNIMITLYYTICCKLKNDLFISKNASFFSIS